MVDQLRFPQWFSPSPVELGLPPNLQRLSRGAVSFARHYTASNDCTPARAALLTGLYTHQTGCMITGGSTLDPGFPDVGHDAARARLQHALARQVAPDPRRQPLDGAQRRTGARALRLRRRHLPLARRRPRPGLARRPAHRAQVRGLVRRRGRLPSPWCTTVSFVNPHDIAWWYAWSDRVAAEAYAPARTCRGCRPTSRRPSCCSSAASRACSARCRTPPPRRSAPCRSPAPKPTRSGCGFLDLYVKLQLEVDRHIGRVLRTLESRPEVAANTVVVFTSDHGEYGASHGLRGKGASAYEECIRVPLIVKDPRGAAHRARPNTPRTQLTSSVDLAPLLLTIGTGSDALAQRPALLAHRRARSTSRAILADPQRARRDPSCCTPPTRPSPSSRSSPTPPTRRCTSSRCARRRPSSRPTPTGPTKGSSRRPQGEEAELYDYGTQGGRLELHNSAGRSPLEEGAARGIRARVQRGAARAAAAAAVAAHARGFADYFSTARHASVNAAARRRHRSEREPGSAPGLPPSTPFRPGRRS